MSQELSLVLAQPVEQLVPLLIKWNNEELMREVELRLARFEGVTYTAEQVGEAKKEKAALNAFIKALNDERIRIGKVYATLICGTMLPRLVLLRGFRPKSMRERRGCFGNSTRERSAITPVASSFR